MSLTDHHEHYNAGFSEGYEAALAAIAEREQVEPLSAEEQFKASLEATVACCPDGWMVVPVKATAEMVQAAEDRHVEGAGYIAENSIQFALWMEVWKAMLNASPHAAGDDTNRRAK